MTNVKKEILPELFSSLLSPQPSDRVYFSSSCLVLWSNVFHAMLGASFNVSNGVPQAVDFQLNANHETKQFLSAQVVKFN